MNGIRRHSNVIVLPIFTILVFLFCYDALRAPFWGDDDLWSNLLPIVHYRQSILVENTPPLYTDLWYGGWYQWKNPLSSFLYLPATATWLVLPLDWGTRLIMTGHLMFSLCAGWMLSSRFVQNLPARFAMSLLLTTPIIPAFYPGHFEKVMAWPWILLGLYFLFGESSVSNRNGLFAGLCLAVVALTGANYYALYAGILFFSILVAQRSIRNMGLMVLGALPGLLHLPSVWHLIGASRTVGGLLPNEIVLQWKELFFSLAFGWVQPIEWEKLAALGVPLLYLFIKFFVRYVINKPRFSLQVILFFDIVLFSFFSTGIINRHTDLLDTFRIPARAIAFVALAILIFVFWSIRCDLEENSSKLGGYNLLLFASLIQILVIWWWIRPPGTQYSPQLADELTAYLMAHDSRSVWFSTDGLDEMFIDVALNNHDIAVPNSYYGDMGQKVPVQGPFCGFSFDYLLSSNVGNPRLASLLYSNLNFGTLLDVVPQDKLIFVRTFIIAEKQYDLYKVACPPHD